MATTILLRRDTAANWSGVNPVLNAGEPGFETDTYRLKIGRSGVAWNNLPYIAGSSGVHWSGVTNKPAIISGISNVTGVISGQILYATGVNQFASVSISGSSGLSINYSPQSNTLTFSSSGINQLTDPYDSGVVSISSGLTKINSREVALGTGTRAIYISGSLTKINGELQVSGTSTFIPSINIYSPGGPGPQCSGVNSDLGSPTINLLTYDSNKKVALRNLDGLFEIVGYGSGVGEYGFPFPGDCVAQEEISTFYINPKTGYISMVSGLVSVYPDGSITANTVYANSGIFGYINFSGSNAVTGVIPGTGIGVYQSGSSYIISNSGVIKLIASSGINISGTSGNYTISSALIAGTGIDLSENSGTYTIRNSGVLNLISGTGIAVTGSNGTYTILNSGVIDLVAGQSIGIYNNNSGIFTISNIGVTNLIASSGINISGIISGQYIISANLIAGSGIGISGVGISGTGGALTIFNTGVLSLIGGTGISISGSNGVFTINSSGVNVPVSGISAGNYINVSSSGGIYTISAVGLQPSGNYSVVGHTHVASDITNFNSAVSGLLPVKDILSGTGISITSVSGTYTITSTGSGILTDQSKSLITTVFNNTASTIPKMSAIYINGGQGDQPTIQLAIATGDRTSAGTYGLTYEPISSMSSGKVIVFGALTGLNTDQFNPTAPTGNVNGSVVYLSPTTSGTLTITKPHAPDHIVAIGTIVRTHQNEGVIEVRVQNGFELEELHNVATTGASNNQAIIYNSASGLWMNTTLTSSLISDFNEAVDDRVGSGLFAAGTGINLNYNDAGNSFAVSVTGLIANPSGNRILTSRDSTTTGIDAERNLTFDGTNLSIGTLNNNDPGNVSIYNSNNGDTQSNLVFYTSSGNYTLWLKSDDDGDSNEILSYTYPLTIYSTSTLNISSVSGTSVSNGNFKIDNQTANTIASFDGSKNITSLSTGTYPSLTELSYVKGVTSSVQTQLNNKQNSLTNPITGTGTTNYVSKFSSSSGLANSQIFDNGTGIGIGTSTPSGQLHVIGTGIFASGINISNQTASTIAGFDASKNVISLSTATYPSLTELSYVKGTTSAIQTQLNSKAATAHTHSSDDVSFADLGLNNIITDDTLTNVMYSVDTAFDNVYNYFSSYQPLLTNPITSSAGGTAGYIPKFSNSTNIANSLIYDTNTRIGIGTISPQQLVHISGNIPTVGNLLRLQNGSPSLRTFVDFRIGSTGNYEDHFFISRSGNDVFGIDTSNRGLFLGNFTQASGKQFQSYNNANAFIELQNSSSNTHIGYISPNNLLFSASYAEKMRLTSGGLLGIGTTTPTGNLHVIGTGIFSTNVGIGTNAPNAALHVVGNTNISGIITATSGTITTLNTVPTYLSPSALSTSQGDWNPGAGDIIRVSASTSGVNISGIVLGNEYARVLINVGTTHNITLKHQATTATSGNRIITSTGGDHIIPPTGTVTILYDTIDSRWRVL